MIIAIYEYTHSAGGKAGYRFVRKYADSDIYHRSKQPTRTKVIAVYLSESQAAAALAQTPEICRITAAIENSSNPDGTLDLSLLNRHLHFAVVEIEYDRRYIRENQPGTILWDSFEKCTPLTNVKETEKTRLLIKAMQLCTDAFGRIDLNIFIVKLNKEIASIFASRLTKNL